MLVASKNVKHTTQGRHTMCLMITKSSHFKLSNKWSSGLFNPIPSRKIPYLGRPGPSFPGFSLEPKHWQMGGRAGTWNWRWLEVANSQWIGNCGQTNSTRDSLDQWSMHEGCSRERFKGILQMKLEWSKRECVQNRANEHNAGSK